MVKRFTVLILSCLFFCACSTGLKNYSPEKKYAQKKLQEDYLLLREVLQAKHPSLYWYTSADSMNFYFENYYHAIKDSMTETEFAWKVIAPLVDKIHCGHTTVSLSKQYAKWADNKIFPSFPLYMKVWNDTMMTMINLQTKDSIFKRGTLIKSINGLSTQQLIDTMFSYLPQDGYANSINYIRMSANFPYYHRNIFGLSKTYDVTYIDSTGNLKSAAVPLFIPKKDTTQKQTKIPAKKTTQKIPRENRLTVYRSLLTDSSGKYAVMGLHTFSKGRLRRFFKKSFANLEENNINHLVIDLRSNGGGKVGLSTLLTRYVTRQPFKVADTLYSVSKSLHPYTKYIKGKFLNNIELLFITHKKKDGYYHLRYLEKKLFYPKNKHHYNGKLYVLTGGPTFSAAALFCNAVKGQDGITLIGEETGGGWYGNDGIMIPDIILPNSKIRVRLPLFRLVQYKHPSHKGSGVIPDIYVGPDYDALLKGYDKKMKVAKEMIMGNSEW